MDFAGAFNGLIDSILQLLPTSPFRPFLSELGQLPYLSWVNWFFPVGDCLRVMTVWLVAITVFYLYSVVMRWVKLLGGS